MSLKERINEDLKTALKSGNKLRLLTVRSIRALILEFEKSGIGREISPEDEINLISSAVKKRRDSIEQYRSAGREDLAQKEEAESKILLEYLPRQLTEEEIYSEVGKIAAEINAKNKEDFSRLMPLAVKTMKGRADGKSIKALVEKFLGQS